MAYFAVFLQERLGSLDDVHTLVDGVRLYAVHKEIKDFNLILSDNVTCNRVKYDETMCSAYVWPRSVQSQGLNLRLNIVWLYFVSALYLLNPWWDVQITLHKCQVWLSDAQFPGLTKVGSRSRSHSKIKHCMSVFRVRSISFKSLVGFTKKNCTHVMYYKTMCSAYVCPRSVQGQGHNLKVNIVWLYFVSALYL